MQNELFTAPMQELCDKYRRLGKRNIARNAALLALYEVFIVVLYFLYHILLEREYTGTSAFGFVVLMCLPFAFKIHKKLFSRGFSGVVVAFNDTDAPTVESFSDNNVKQNRLIDLRYSSEIKVDTGEGGVIKFSLTGDKAVLCDIYYRPGDVVALLPGLNYPVNLSHEERDVFCPVCGGFTEPTRRRCFYCHRPIVRRSEAEAEK